MRRVQGPNGEEKSQQYEKDLSDLMAHRLIFSADHALCKEKSSPCLTHWVSFPTLLMSLNCQKSLSDHWKDFKWLSSSKIEISDFSGGTAALRF